MTNPEALAMLWIARRDLKAAQMLQVASIDEASWGFQIQQAVEKAIKAWLFQLGDDPPLIHNLTAAPYPHRRGPPLNVSLSPARSRTGGF
jgi:HEPN domain-containing protein